MFHTDSLCISTQRRTAFPSGPCTGQCKPGKMQRAGSKQLTLIDLNYEIWMGWKMTQTSPNPLRHSHSYMALNEILVRDLAGRCTASQRGPRKPRRKHERPPLALRAGLAWSTRIHFKQFPFLPPTPTYSFAHCSMLRTTHAPCKCLRTHEVHMPRLHRSSSPYFIKFTLDFQPIPSQTIASSVSVCRLFEVSGPAFPTHSVS